MPGTPAVRSPDDAPRSAGRARAGAQASVFFWQHVLEDLLVERQLGDELIEPRVLPLEILQPRELGLRQRPVLLAPAIERGLGYTVLPAELRHRHPGLRLLDGIPDLLLREPTRAHRAPRSFSENFSYRLGPGNGEDVSGWVPLTLSQLWEYREVLYFLIWRDIKVRYRQTLIGVTWAIIQPFMTMVVFSVFFSRLAKMPSDDTLYPLFAFAALVPWTFFPNGLTLSANS
jgi:hypothetical protein